MEKKKINIVEIGPRDGFQNIEAFISTQTKIRFIEKVIEAGVRRVQITSFVNAAAIPQLQDAKEVTETILEKYGAQKELEFFALTPNRKGVENACKAGLKEVAYVISVSEAHNKANINRTVDQSYDELKEILNQFPEVRITVDVATAFACPFEGLIPMEKTLDFVNRGVEMGIRHFNLCDTIGAADPCQVRALTTAVQNRFPGVEFDVHIHDTRNMGIVNSLAAIECGIKNVQTTIGGLGGCPFAPGASGNTATEDLVYLLERMGFETGIDFDRLLSTTRQLKTCINGNFSGHHLNIPEECQIKLI